MEITDVAAATAGIQAGGVQAAFTVGVLRQALDQQQSSAAQLLAALPKPLPAGSTFQAWA